MMYAVGLMSGTSFDGIDAALVKIHEDEKRHITYDLIHFITKPFKEGIKEEIECAISLDQSNVQLICSLNFKLGYELAEAVKLTCEEANFPLDKLDFVASHGQTIWHNPDVSDSFVPSTLQIGESAIIAYETNCQVISNFRVMDVAAGGQGAPLVAYTDYIIYRDHEKNVVLQNIGGIANLTYIPKEKLIDDVIAFDTGPGNMMLDYMTRTYFNVPYDRDGQIARKGRVIPKLLKELMDDPYIKKKPPKTTGREYFGSQYVDAIITRYPEESKVDILTTFTHFVAESILYQYRSYLESIDRVILSGGGCYNQYLVELIEDNLDCEVNVLDAYGENANAKEAIALALLGYQTLHHRPNNAKHATGASKYVILGHITPKPVS